MEVFDTIMKTAITYGCLFDTSIPVKTPKFLAVVATVQRSIIKTPTTFLHAMHSDSACRRAGADDQSGDQGRLQYNVLFSSIHYFRFAG